MHNVPSDCVNRPDAPWNDDGRENPALLECLAGDHGDLLQEHAAYWLDKQLMWLAERGDLSVIFLAAIGEEALSDYDKTRLSKELVKAENAWLGEDLGPWIRESNSDY